MYKFYLSYWSGGYTTGYNKLKKPSPFLIDMVKLCSFLIRKHYGSPLVLLTDSYSKDLFKDCYHIDEIRTSLDELNEDLGDKITYNWAIGKLYAYKQIAEKNEPFLHVDYDVFLFKPLPDFILNKDLVVQNMEDYIFFGSKKTFLQSYNVYLFDEYVKNRHEFPHRLLNRNIFPYNVGIFGGTNCGFISQYANKAIEFTLDPQNNELCRALYQFNRSSPATFIEQYYLSVLAQKYNVPVFCLLEGTGEDCDKQALKYGYTHLTLAKSESKVQDKVKELVKEIEILINQEKEHRAKNL
jgi:protein involved in ribonucleotide reduction